MAPAGTVAQIWRHPVKSMQGEGLETGTLTEIGLEGDRRWGVIDAATDKVLSAKREPRLLEGRARLVNGGPEISLPDGAVVCFGDPGADEALSRWLTRAVRLERAVRERAASYEMNVDATDEGSALVEFTCPPGTFLDAAAVHLLTTASIRAVADAYTEGSWDVRRFRPTLLVDCEGTGYVEDAWIGSTVRAGTAALAVFAPTVRCVVTARAQEELPRDLGIARTVHRVHGSNLGVYAAVRVPGEVRVGDRLELGDTE